MRLHQWNSSFLRVHNVAGELVSEMHKQIKCVVVSKVTCLSRRLSLTSLLPQNELASGSICVYNNPYAVCISELYIVQFNVFCTS